MTFPPLAGPPGHIPGIHIPGTLTPIGAVYEMQRQQLAAQQAAEDAERERRINLLLLLTT